MGKLRLEVLSQAEMEHVHARSLDVLERVGLRVVDEECRRALVRAGAAADPMDRVTLPRQMVEELRALAPAAFALHRADGKLIPIERGRRAYGSLVIDPWVIDYATGTPRRPLLADVVRHTRLGDALPIVSFIYRMDMPPADLPERTAYIRTLEAVAANTTKHVMAGPASVELTHDWIEIAEIMAGDKTLAERPVITMGAPVTTPLVFDGLNGYILRTCIGKGLPLAAQTEPIAGTTAPLSFAGGLLMANAENLFLVALAQALRPGQPIFYSAGNALTDLSDGSVIFYNADKMLWKIASDQMADFYNLPTEGESTGSLTGRWDIQCGIEYGLLMLPTPACGWGLFNGLGSCYNACGMSPEHIVIQADMLALTERIAAGIDTSDEMLAFESIATAGPGGHFLEDPLTIRMLRSGEFYTAGCFDRLGERSPNAPEDGMLARAHARVEELVRSHTPAVPERTIEELGRWARQKEAERG